MVYRFGIVGLVACLSLFTVAGEPDTNEARLVAAMLGKTSTIDNLASLTDEIGGRPTGSRANLAAVDWALERFRERGVSARKEAFSMPGLWLERGASALVEGDVSFTAEIVAMPFSATTEDGFQAPLVDVGFGEKQDFDALAGKVNGAMVLVHTHELLDLDGLFREYAVAPKIENRAVEAGAVGVVYMSSRPGNLLYRHNASEATRSKLPMMIMERESAMRVSRLLGQGKSLTIRPKIQLHKGDSYTSYNVIGEIKGSERPEEFVVMGAHLDSWDLGTGALDNGCNVAMLIEIAAQMKALGIVPKRTIRFCLWNGEEQGLYGSYGYTRAHASELDRHVMAASLDIGSGRLQGFYVDGSDAFLKAVEQSLEGVAGLGPFQHVRMAVVGTDNYDFMMQGVANLVGNQASANYGPHYHAESDTFDKVDQSQLRLNGAIVAAVTYAFAQMDVTWKRRTRAELEVLVKESNLEGDMRSWGAWEGWLDGTRGRKE